MSQFIGVQFLKADEFRHYKDWPVWARLAFFNSHKKRRDRFNLWLFFWANGMRPERAVFWTMYHMTYDTKAWLSMEDLVKHTESKKGLAYLNKFPVFDIEQGYVIRT